jgi:hypothetical protein
MERAIVHLDLDTFFVSCDILTVLGKGGSALLKFCTRITIQFTLHNK